MAKYRECATSFYVGLCIGIIIGGAAAVLGLALSIYG